MSTEQMSTEVVPLDTPLGEARLHVDRAEAPGGPVLLLSHGAGNGVDTLDLEALARALPAQGVPVVRLEQPWRVAGRKVATPPPTLDVGLRTAAAALASLDLGGPGGLVVGGRSAGARSALRCAAGLAGLGCLGALALAFPLHPPGKPEASRLPELLDAGVPALVVQGERDPFGRPEELPDPLPEHVELHVVPAADHSLRTAARGPVGQDAALAAIVAAVLAWLPR